MRPWSSPADRTMLVRARVSRGRIATPSSTSMTVDFAHRSALGPKVAIDRGILRRRLSQAKALVFDCDGTLVDTPPVYARAWRAGFREAGHDMPLDWYLERAGASETRLVEQFAHWRATVLDARPIVVAMRRSFHAELHRIRELHAVTRIVRGCHGRLPMAVASGGSREIVEATLDATGLTGLFDEIVTFDDVGRAKPEPDIFLAAARRLGVAAADCLAFEDSMEGLEAARRAGMAVIDVSTIIAARQAPASSVKTGSG